MDYKISLISTYPELTELARQTVAESNEHVLVAEGILQKALDKVRQHEHEGAEVIITTGLNIEYLRERTATPVVTIPITSYDLICTLHELQHNHERIAIYQYRRSNPRLEKIKQILQIEVMEFVFNDTAEAREKLIEARDLGATIHVAGAQICLLAQEMGLPAIHFEIRREAIIQAIETAKEVAYVRRKEKQGAIRLQAIIDFAYEGIIATDSMGRVTVANPSALKILNMTNQDIVGKPLGNFIPYPTLEKVLKHGEHFLGEIQSFGDHNLVVNYIPIIVGDRIQGAVINFEDVVRIQKIEQKIRREVYSKGHTARYHFADIIGESQALKKVILDGKRFATTDETVLIAGESGVGKELFAQSIHNYSRRSHDPFVAINCTAIPSTLLESELFGYADGAFTGAKKGGKPGLFELAHGGTIFLDEIGDISEDLQSRLLRVLQEKEVMRLGGNKVLPVDVRIVAATNRDLKTEIVAKRFREDLYYRLNVLQLLVPPLRERKEDILLIARHILSQAEFGLNREKILELLACLKPLLDYGWPGNVRELENVLRRLVVFAGDKINQLEIEEFIREITCPGSVFLDNSQQIDSEASLTGNAPHLGMIMEELQKNIIVEMLKNGSNKTEMAQKLGIGRTTLWRKLKALGIDL